MAAAMTPPVVKVYHGNPMLPDVARVLACLYEKDVKFELIDMFAGQHMNPDLIKFQASRAPISGFEDGNTRLFESRAICRHIVDKYADRGNKYLLGKDLLERASIEQWLKSEEHSFDPPSWALVFHLAFKVEPDRALITQSERRLSKVLDVYEQRLGESKFLAGDDFSLADLSHLPNSHYLASSKEWGHLFESRKNVRNWWGEISSRRSWQEVVKILNERGLLKDTTATKSTTQNKHQLRQRESAKSPAQQVTNDDKSSAQPGQKQEQGIKPRGQTDSSSGQNVTQQAPSDAQSLNGQTSPAATSSQEKDPTTKALAQRESDRESTNLQARSDTQPSNVSSETSSKRQEQKSTSTRQADSASQLAPQQAPTGAQFSTKPDSSEVLSNQQQERNARQTNFTEQSATKQTPTDAKTSSPLAAPSVQPNQTQDQNTKPMSKTDSADQSITQKAPTNDQLTQKQDSVGQAAAQDEPSGARSSSKSTTPVTLPTQKQDQRKTEPMNQENASLQSTAREAPANVKSAPTPSTNSASPGQNREQDILPGIQAASIGQSKQVSTNGPQSKDAITKEFPTDAQASLIQKKEQMNQANSAGRSTAPADGQQSSQAGTLGGSPSKNGWEGTQKKHQADSASQFTAPGAPDNATPAKVSSAPGALSSPKAEQKVQPDPTKQSSAPEAPTDGQQPNQGGTFGKSAVKEASTDAQASKPASNSSSNQMKEETTKNMDQKEPAIQSTSPRAPTDVKPANHQVYPPSNATSNNSPSQTNSTGNPSSEATPPTQPAS